MTAVIKAQDRVISEVSRIFQAVRDSRVGQPRYPAEAKKTAVSAIERGHSATAVARAAGVSRGSVIHWQVRENNRADTAQPIHLKLVKSRGRNKTKPKYGRIEGYSRKPTVRIHFRSGAVMEVTTDALTTSLIAALNGEGL